jgi:hypothetical protein
MATLAGLSLIFKSTWPLGGGLLSLSSIGTGLEPPELAPLKIALKKEANSIFDPFLSLKVKIFARKKDWKIRGFLVGHYKCT